MQKDFHFYVTYALARKMDINKKEAKLIAWANQYTDDLNETDLYGIQTQVGLLGHWFDKQIQLSVLIPFHFIPGDDLDWPWKTTENSERARTLLGKAVASKDLLRLGISLHMLQDTFTHQGFSGWQEKKNSCYPWYHMSRIAPNVGHTEMRTTPDQIEEVWKDPRAKDGKRIINKKRAIKAARATYDALDLWKQARGVSSSTAQWNVLKPAFETIFKNREYDARKEELRALSDESGMYYSKIRKNMEKRYGSNFMKAATLHLTDAMSLFDGLPRIVTV